MARKPHYRVKFTKDCYVLRRWRPQGAIEELPESYFLQHGNGTFAVPAHMRLLDMADPSVPRPTATVVTKPAQGKVIDEAAADVPTGLGKPEAKAEPKVAAKPSDAKVTVTVAGQAVPVDLEGKDKDAQIVALKQALDKMSVQYRWNAGAAALKRLYDQTVAALNVAPATA